MQYAITNKQVNRTTNKKSGKSYSENTTILKQKSKSVNALNLVPYSK